MLPDSTSWTDAIKVIDGGTIKKGKKLYLNADTMKQIGVLYLNK